MRNHKIPDDGPYIGVRFALYSFMNDANIRILGICLICPRVLKALNCAAIQIHKYDFKSKIYLPECRAYDKDQLVLVSLDKADLINILFNYSCLAICDPQLD